MKEKTIFIIIVLTLLIPLTAICSQLNNGFDVYEVIPGHGRNIVGHRGAFLSEYLFVSGIWMILVLAILSGFYEKEDIIWLREKLCK